MLQSAANVSTAAAIVLPKRRRGPGDEGVLPEPVPAGAALAVGGEQVGLGAAGVTHERDDVTAVLEQPPVGLDQRGELAGRIGRGHGRRGGQDVGGVLDGVDERTG